MSHECRGEPSVTGFSFPKGLHVLRKTFRCHDVIMQVAWHKTAVTPMLTHGKYCSFALSLDVIGTVYISVKNLNDSMCEMALFNLTYDA